MKMKLNWYRNLTQPILCTKLKKGREEQEGDQKGDHGWSFSQEPHLRCSVSVNSPQPFLIFHYLLIILIIYWSHMSVQEKPVVVKLNENAHEEQHLSNEKTPLLTYRKKAPHYIHSLSQNDKMLAMEVS